MQGMPARPNDKRELSANSPWKVLKAKYSAEPNTGVSSIATIASTASSMLSTKERAIDLLRLGRCVLPPSSACAAQRTMVHQPRPFLTFLCPPLRLRYNVDHIRGASEVNDIYAFVRQLRFFEPFREDNAKVGRSHHTDAASYLIALTTTGFDRQSAEQSSSRSSRRVTSFRSPQMCPRSSTSC